MQVDVYSRWYRAYIAYNRAKNPTFKALWHSIMLDLQKGF